MGFLISPVPLTQASEPELRVLSLKHRLADEVAPLLRPLLAPGESVNSLDSRLIVRAAPPTHRQIENLLAKIDTPRRNLRISVRHAGQNARVTDDQGVSGDIHRGNTRIVVSNDTRNTGGMTVKRSGPDGTVLIHSERRITTKNNASNHNLTVMDGGRAFLRVGESIPMVQSFLALVGNRVTVMTGVQYYDVTTGFEVEPRIVTEASFTERIQLTMTPRLAFRSNQGTQTFNFQELHTVVMVNPGEWVDLGGAVESNNEVNRHIFNTRGRNSHEDSRFLIRVDPQ